MELIGYAYFQVRPIVWPNLCFLVDIWMPFIKNALSYCQPSLSGLHIFFCCQHFPCSQKSGAEHLNMALRPIHAVTCLVTSCRDDVISPANAICRCSYFKAKTAFVSARCSLESVGGKGRAIVKRDIWIGFVLSVGVLCVR